MLELYYFNYNIIYPIIFFTTKIHSDIEETFLEEHTEYLFEVLINNNMATTSNILVFNIIKEHTSKIINWILPSTNSNTQILEELEKKEEIINIIIKETLSKSDCNTIFTFENDELKIRECKINLEELIYT